MKSSCLAKYTQLLKEAYMVKVMVEAKQSIYVKKKIYELLEIFKCKLQNLYKCLFLLPVRGNSINI